MPLLSIGTRDGAIYGERVNEVGVLGHGASAAVDDRGLVSTAVLSIGWLVGADDRWHVPAHEVTIYQRRGNAAPIYETIVRVPGGEVSHRVYGVATGSAALTVIEIENRSPVPLTVALVVTITRPGVIEVDGNALRVDGFQELTFSRAARAWAPGPKAAEVVMAGDARTGPIGTLAGPPEIALLFPVPHRTCIRAAVANDAGGLSGPMALDVRDLPGTDAVARGWERQLERGLQAHLPPPVGELVDPARADLLLRSKREPGVVSALEDWGFDDEAAAGWAALGWRARRRAKQRVRPADPWPGTRAADATLDPARFLSALHGVLVDERPGAIDILPGFPTDWLGQPLTVESLPLRQGVLSFAVRWHGARPALLWEAPEGVELRAPALDPAWSSNAPAGEALLSEPPMALLPMGTQERSSGEPVEAPGQFS